LVVLRLDNKSKPNIFKRPDLLIVCTDCLSLK